VNYLNYSARLTRGHLEVVFKRVCKWNGRLRSGNAYEWHCSVMDAIGL